MRMYDLVLVFRTSVKEDGRKKLLETVMSWFPDAKVAKEDDWGQKLLAYPIKKETAGHYYLLQIESEVGATKDAEERLIRSADILRHLLVRTK